MSSPAQGSSAAMLRPFTHRPPSPPPPGPPAARPPHLLQHPLRVLLGPRNHGRNALRVCLIHVRVEVLPHKVAVVRLRLPARSTAQHSKQQHSTGPRRCRVVPGRPTDRHLTCSVQHATTAVAKDHVLSTGGRRCYRADQLPPAPPCTPTCVGGCRAHHTTWRSGTAGPPWRAAEAVPWWRQRHPIGPPRDRGTHAPGERTDSDSIE